MAIAPTSAPTSRVLGFGMPNKNARSAQLDYKSLVWRLKVSAALQNPSYWIHHGLYRLPKKLVQEETTCLAFEDREAIPELVGHEFLQQRPRQPL